MQLLARTLRYLATRFLADPDRADRDQPRQNTARTNAAEASATMKQRRHDLDEVDAYLHSRSRGHSDEQAATGQDGHGTERAM